MITSISNFLNTICALPSFPKFFLYKAPAISLRVKIPVAKAPYPYLITLGKANHPTHTYHISILPSGGETLN